MGSNGEYWLVALAGLTILGSLVFWRHKNRPGTQPNPPDPDLPIEKIMVLEAELERMIASTTYPACSSISPDLHRSAQDPKPLRRGKTWTDDTGHSIPISRAFQSFAANPVTFRENCIRDFLRQEGAKWALFFDTIEKEPLTPEQRLAVMSDEDATLVLAGAGSGKTSVITAKAAYLVKAGIRRPEEILLLAFAKDAAQEMSERIHSRTGLPVTARTFHALAYDILGAVEGSKPALAPHASDDKAFIDLLRGIVEEIIAAGSVAASALLFWLTGGRLNLKTEWDFATKHDWYHHVEQLNLRTLQGEQVRSFEELMIANWLYTNGIAYEYEPR